MVYEVTHRTEYRYSSTVSSSFGEIVMLPRDLPGQVCLRSQLTIDPQPHDLRERLDFFGNRTAYFAVLAPHTRLSVTATSLVRVCGRRAAPGPAGAARWERARDGIRDGSDADAFDARQFVLDSLLVAISGDLTEYAAPSFPRGRPVLAALGDLSSRIHRDFDYEPGATHITTTIEEVLERRAGVCQDFAPRGRVPALPRAGRSLCQRIPRNRAATGAAAAGRRRHVARLGVGVRARRRLDRPRPNQRPAGGRPLHHHRVGPRLRRRAPLKGVIFTQADDHSLRVTVDVVPVDSAD